MIYVMSDIHGNLRRFNSIMEQINLTDKDTLYVLGDVIDRYPDGIRILRKLMAMDNVKMTIGNHEDMMLKSLYTNDTGLSAKEQFKHEQMVRLWYDNGGRVTHNYLKHIRKNLRTEIFTYLESLPVSYDITVNGKDYKLVHAAPEEMFDEYYKLRYTESREFAVWHRITALRKLWQDSQPHGSDSMSDDWRTICPTLSCTSRTASSIFCCRLPRLLPNPKYTLCISLTANVV